MHIERALSHPVCCPARVPQPRPNGQFKPRSPTTPDSSQTPVMPNHSNPFASVPPTQLLSEDFARKEDGNDSLSQLRHEFVIPTKGDLRNKRYGPQDKTATATGEGDDGEESIYLCGNSLGLQPRRTRDYVQRYLDTWASKGAFGHFRDLEGGLPPWMHLDDALKQQTARIVGALPSEVVVMETLTANLHLLMSSFYRPTTDRYKIIIEGKAFPSDHVSASAAIIPG